MSMLWEVNKIEVDLLIPMILQDGVLELYVVKRRVDMRFLCHEFEVGVALMEKDVIFLHVPIKIEEHLNLNLMTVACLVPCLATVIKI